MEKRQSGPQMDEGLAACALPHLRLPDAASAVQGVPDKALAYCAAEMRLRDPEAALELLRRGDRIARWYSHHSLGGQVAHILGDLDSTVQSVLVFDLEAPPEDLLDRQPGPVLPVHLVVQVECKSDALYDLVSALEQALVEEYTGRVGPVHRHDLLEVQVIDAHDVEKRRGYAGLYGSLLDCPIQVWQR